MLPAISLRTRKQSREAKPENIDPIRNHMLGIQPQLGGSGAIIVPHDLLNLRHRVKNLSVPFVNKRLTKRS